MSTTPKNLTESPYNAKMRNGIHAVFVHLANCQSCRECGRDMLVTKELGPHLGTLCGTTVTVWAKVENNAKAGRDCEEVTLEVSHKNPKPKLVQVSSLWSRGECTFLEGAHTLREPFVGAHGVPCFCKAVFLVELW